MSGLPVRCDEGSGDENKWDTVLLHYMRIVTARAERASPYSIFVMKEVAYEVVNEVIFPVGLRRSGVRLRLGNGR